MYGSNSGRPHLHIGKLRKDGSRPDSSSSTIWTRQVAMRNNVICMIESSTARKHQTIIRSPGARFVQKSCVLCKPFSYECIMPRPWMRQLRSLSPACVAHATRAEPFAWPLACFGTVKHAECRCTALRGRITDRRLVAKGGGWRGVLDPDEYESLRKDAISLVSSPCPFSILCIFSLTTLPVHQVSTDA